MYMFIYVCLLYRVFLHKQLNTCRLQLIIHPKVIQESQKARSDSSKDDAAPELDQLQYRRGFGFQTVFESVRKKRAEKRKISCSANDDPHVFLRTLLRKDEIRE